MNVRYLLGAGASFNSSVPILKDMPTDLVHVGSVLRSIGIKEQNNVDFRIINQIAHETNPEVLNMYQKIGDTLIHIGNNSRFTYSVDTFISQNKNSPDYELYKLSISIYLLIKQFKGRLDTRYDAFLTNTLIEHNQTISLPHNIQILTWNYDIQLLLSFIRATGSSKENTNEIIKIFNDFNFIRLNGSCFTETIPYFNNFNDFYYPEDFSINMVTVQYVYINELIERFIKKKKNVTDLRFIWDLDSADKEQLFKNISSFKANILIIIGYSLPDLNRKVDREIIKNQYYDEVILQCDSKDADALQEKLKEIDPQINLRYRASNSDFYIPDEILG